MQPFLDSGAILISLPDEEPYMPGQSSPRDRNSGQGSVASDFLPGGSPLIFDTFGTTNGNSNRPTR